MNNTKNGLQNKTERFGQPKQPQSPIEELRQILTQLENTVARIADCTPEQALEIPIKLDWVVSQIDALDQSGVKIEIQTTQFQTIAAQLRTRMRTFIKQVGGRQALKQARLVHQPQSDHWWWFVDEIWATEIKEKLIRQLRNLGITAAILVIAGIFYNKYFAPDPALKASLSHQQSAEKYLMLGDFELAIKETNAALTYSPESAELLILKGVILDQLGQVEEATESYEQAMAFLDQEYLFYVQRALNYLVMGKAEHVIAECDIALQLNPDSAVCYMQQGQAYELLGDIGNAIERLEIADETAERLGNPQLQAIIRVNLSNVLQKMPATPTSEIEN